MFTDSKRALQISSLPLKNKNKTKTNKQTKQQQKTAAAKKKKREKKAFISLKRLFQIPLL